MITFTQYVLTYLVSVVIFFAIDMTWLGFIARDFYKKHLGHLLGDVVWPVAILFYLTFLVGLLIFAIGPALKAESLSYALMWGALFGFFTYMTYDLTNWSTLKDWSATVSIVDILWGTFLSASVASLTYLVASNFIIK
jgi:uncharacterized membrane protein